MEMFPIFVPVLPIAVAILPKIPGRFALLKRMVLTSEWLVTLLIEWTKIV